jgi:hypothetical protein
MKSTVPWSLAKRASQGRAYRRCSPLMVKTERNPGGTPIEVFDSFRKALAENRAQFFLDVASGPFYGFNRTGEKASQGIIQNWWRQGMIGCRPSCSSMARSRFTRASHTA